MKKILAWVASLFSLYILMWWFLQIILEHYLSEVINYHRPTVVLQYETLHLDFLLRFVELTGVQIIPQKQELGVFLVSSLKLDNWGRKQGYWFTTLTFQGVHVASTGAFKNILENLGYQDDALDTEAEITLAYDPTSQKLTVDFLQDTPQLGHLKGTTTVALETKTLTALEVQYKEKTFLKRMIPRTSFAKELPQLQNFLMTQDEIRIQLKSGYALLLQEIQEADFAQLLPKLKISKRSPTPQGRPVLS